MKSPKNRNEVIGQRNQLEVPVCGEIRWVFFGGGHWAAVIYEEQPKIGKSKVVLKEFARYIELNGSGTPKICAYSFRRAKSINLYSIHHGLVRE